MHWYLMIVSNPGKVLEVTPTTRQPASPPAPSSSRALRSNKQRNTEDQETSVLGTLLKPEQAREEVTSRFFEPMSHDPGCETRVETTGTGEQFEPVGTPRGEVPTRRLQDMGLDDVRLEGAEESPTCVEPSVLENPYVLTLDSLGASHRPQSQTVLRYLLHEAEDKLNRSLSDLLLKSVEVKKVSVPEQPNYCDCGLYLIHAFKVFFSNPTAKLQWILDNGKSRKKSGDSWQAEVCQTWNASGATQARKGLKEKILRLIPEYHEVENQKKMQDSLAAQTAKVPPLNMRIDINPPKRRRLDFMSDNPPGAELQSRVQQPQSERRCLVESGAVTNPQENVQIREEIEGLSLHKAGHPNSGQRSPQSRSPPSSPSIVSVHEISNQNISVTKARSTIESVKTEDFEMMSSDLERRLKEPLKAHSGQHTGIEDVPPGLINHMLNSVGASGPSENANKGVGSGRPGTDPDRVSTPPGSPKSAATAGTPLGDPSPSGALLPDMLDVHPNEGMPCGSLATSIYLNPSLSSLPDHYVTHPGLHAFEYCGSREVNEFKNWGLEAEAFRDLRCQPGPGPDVSAFEHKRNPGDCEHSVGAKITRRSKKPRISPPVERPGQYDSRAIDQRPKSESGGEHNPLAVDDD